VRLQWSGRVSKPLLEIVVNTGGAHSPANGYSWDLGLCRGSSAASSSRLPTPVLVIAR
jgi:hypothetical protein